MRRKTMQRAQTKIELGSQGKTARQMREERLRVQREKEKQAELDRKKQSKEKRLADQRWREKEREKLEAYKQSKQNKLSPYERGQMLRDKRKQEDHAREEKMAKEELQSIKHATGRRESAIPRPSEASSRRKKGMSRSMTTTSIPVINKEYKTPPSKLELRRCNSASRKASLIPILSPNQEEEKKSESIKSEEAMVRNSNQNEELTNMEGMESIMESPIPSPETCRIEPLGFDLERKISELLRSDVEAKEETAPSPADISIEDMLGPSIEHLLGPGPLIIKPESKKPKDEDNLSESGSSTSTDQNSTPKRKAADRRKETLQMVRDRAARPSIISKNQCKTSIQEVTVDIQKDDQGFLGLKIKQQYDGCVRVEQVFNQAAIGKVLEGDALVFIDDEDVRSKGVEAIVELMNAKFKTHRFLKFVFWRIVREENDPAQENKGSVEKAQTTAEN